MFNRNSKVQFFNTYKFSHHDINKFILFLQKDVYRHEYMDYWKKFNKKLLLEKGDFYSSLYKDINDADYSTEKE